MKIALVHDYLSEMGGAERVLLALSEMFPEAPIYTAFSVPGSSAAKAFANRKIVTSWFQNVPFFGKLYSPLRFLIPQIWGSFDFSGFDLIITSASWYITKGLGKKWGVKEICYCHTPPRWLYGYETSINWQKYFPVRWYGELVGHFLRMYDYSQAQKVDLFVANSKNVKDRINKFYRRDAEVIYPPVETDQKSGKTDKNKTGDYYLMVTRVVGGKGIELALDAAEKLGDKFKLVIAGEAAGWSGLNDRILKSDRVIYKGRVDEKEKTKLMSGAKAFLALAKDEDFGITPIEALAAGTPVIAYNSGGYRETVENGKTGIFFDEYSVEGLTKAIRDFDKLKWDRQELINKAKVFSKKRFQDQMLSLVKRYAGTSRD